MVNLTPADVQDAAGAEQIIAAVRKRWPWLKHLFADGAYDRGRLASAAAYRDFVVEVVCKLEGQQGFQPLPRRWVVERTFGWISGRKGRDEWVCRTWRAPASTRRDNAQDARQATLPTVS